VKGRKKTQETELGGHKFGLTDRQPIRLGRAWEYRGVAQSSSVSPSHQAASGIHFKTRETTRHGTTAPPQKAASPSTHKRARGGDLGPGHQRCRRRRRRAAASGARRPRTPPTRRSTPTRGGASAAAWTTPTTSSTGACFPLPLFPSPRLSCSLIGLAILDSARSLREIVRIEVTRRGFRGFALPFAANLGPASVDFYCGISCD
jgi:hypothetical protein